MTVALCWLLFGGSHLVLSSSPLRNVIEKSLGRPAFLGLYSFLSVCLLLLLGYMQLLVGGEGPLNPLHVAFYGAKILLGLVAGMGFAVMVAGFVSFGGSAMARLAWMKPTDKRRPGQTLPPPSGVFLLTRHPFLLGVFVFSASHVSLSENLTAAIFFGGFSGLTLVGIWLQDRKLVQRFGKTYLSYVNLTRVIPEKASIAEMAPRVRERWHQVAQLSVIAACAYVFHEPLWEASHGAVFAFLLATGGMFAVLTQVRIKVNRKNAPVMPKLPPESCRTCIDRMCFNMFPAFRRTGGRIVHISRGETHVRLKLPLNWRTKNPFGTIFGGSMYAAVDPIYTAMFSRRFGAKISVRDKVGSIKHIKPGRSELYADFCIDDAEVAVIKDELSRQGKVDRTYLVELKTASGDTCAALTKTIAFRFRE